MTKKPEDTPSFIFFRETPEELLDHPPLASSLQNLETSFFLISLQRYPHALISCASAIESAIKAVFNINQNHRLHFKDLFDKAQEKFPILSNFSSSDIKDFRDKRNEIIHYGFSPKDDEISAILLLQTGYPLIEQCYQTFFQFPLKREGKKYGGLVPDFDLQLDISERVFHRAKTITGFNMTYCFIAFAHAIRWGIQHWMMADWQRHMLESANEELGLKWDLQEKQKRTLSYETFDASWEFNCPICHEPGSCICELDDDELDKGNIQLKMGVCTNCSLIIPKNCPFLADELCKDQIDDVRPKILQEYGIKL